MVMKRNLFQIKKEIWPLLIISAMLIGGYFTYPFLPPQVPSHWNFNGQVNGWMNAAFAAFFFPLIVLGSYLFLSFLAFVDPFYKNIEKSYKAFWQIKLFFVIFLAIIYGVILAGGVTHQQMPINKIVIFSIALLFIALGMVMPQIKRNFFIGMRFPWTIKSDAVWQKTHLLARSVFIATGFIIAAAGFLRGVASFILMLFVLFGGMVFLATYSYLEYEKTHNK